MVWTLVDAYGLDPCGPLWLGPLPGLDPSGPLWLVQIRTTPRTSRATPRSPRTSLRSLLKEFLKEFLLKEFRSKELFCIELLDFLSLRFGGFLYALPWESGPKRARVSGEGPPRSSSM